MTLALPRVRQRPSANYTPVAIQPRLIVLHMTEGGYEGSVAWLCDPRAKASAHLCLKADGSEISQLVPLGMKAWAQCQFNAVSIGLEIEGFTAQGLSDVTLDAVARVVARLARAYGIPPVWAQRGEGRGICCHHDLGAAGGGHTDICGIGDATWLRVMAAIEAAHAAQGEGPLAPFALHGLPGPHEVEPPPDVTPTPSHGGQPRCTPGDVHMHPTWSRYPAHSIAALQSDLDDVANAQLLIDGRFGDKTRDALRAFQIKQGLVGDGVPGPATWSALDAAMAKAA